MRSAYRLLLAKKVIASKPAFRLCRSKDVTIDPRDQAPPHGSRILQLCALLLQVLEEPGAPIAQEPGHRRRHAPVPFHYGSDPVGECFPVHVVGNCLLELTGSDSCRRHRTSCRAAGAEETASLGPPGANPQTKDRNPAAPTASGHCNAPSRARPVPTADRGRHNTQPRSAIPPRSADESRSRGSTATGGARSSGSVFAPSSGAKPGHRSWRARATAGGIVPSASTTALAQSTNAHHSMYAPIKGASVSAGNLRASRLAFLAIDFVESGQSRPRASDRIFSHRIRCIDSTVLGEVPNDSGTAIVGRQ